MLCVTFTFRADVPLEKQEVVLNEINKWKSIYKATRLNPHSQNPQLLRMCHVYLRENNALDDILNKLAEIPEIEHTDIPTERSLIN